MTDQRKRLIDLLWNAPETDLGFRSSTEEIADYLIANGVTVSETSDDVMSVADATFPEELCGKRGAFNGSGRTGRCVLPKGHYELEGQEKHSWQK